MAASCLVPPNGHQKVLEAMTKVSQKSNQGSVNGSDRFHRIVDGFLLGDENYRLKTSCITLINAIISSPNSLDFRMHLRNEFIRQGLKVALEVGKLNTCFFILISLSKLGNISFMSSENYKYFSFQTED